MPRDPTDGRIGIANDFQGWISGVADWLMVTLFSRLGPIIIGLAAVYVSVRAFGESSGDGIKAIVAFAIPTMWGAGVLAFGSRSRTGLSTVGKWAVPALGALVGIALGIGMFVAAPVWSANFGLGVMEGFYFMMWLPGEGDDVERSWGIALLILVSIVAFAFAFQQ